MPDVPATSMGGVVVEAETQHATSTSARHGSDVFANFDYNAPVFNEHMNDILDDQLRHCPVARSNVGSGYWWITRNEDVRKVGQDWKTFSSAQGYQPNRMEGMPWIYPVEMDPPYQTAWRKVLNPHLSPAVVEGFEQNIRADANTLIDRFVADGKCEFISEFGVLLPGWAFFKNSLGLPVELLGDLLTAIEASLFGPMLERVDQLKKSFVLLDSYLKQRLTEPPQGDMVDTILKGVIYPDGTECTWDHKLGIAADMTLGGIGTTTYVMGSALHYLAENPAARQQLISHPEMVDNAVEEFIRAFPPVIGVGRSCTRDVEIGGAQMKKGDFALIVYAAASRDPRVVENPDEIDLNRDSVVHSTFGVGPHRCIGSNLARAEVKVTLQEWLKRIPNFSVKGDTKPSYETSQLRQMTSLHLVW